MKKLIIFTDLDGTLLDHENYKWQAALPAIERLHSLDFPLIYTSSKTSAEMSRFNIETNNHHPFICENGSAIAIPKNYFAGQSLAQNEIIQLGANYETILQVLADLRKQYQYKFVGFNDSGIKDIMALTNLDEDHAILAKQRHASEPIKWLDTELALTHFSSHLENHNLSITKGGRFYSVMGRCSKGDAVDWLLDKYRKNEPETDWISVALGDSQNDMSMLENVDYPILISNPHSPPPDTGKLNNLTRPKQPGPMGWNTAVNNLLDLIQ